MKRCFTIVVLVGLMAALPGYVGPALAGALPVANPWFEADQPDKTWRAGPEGSRKDGTISGWGILGLHGTAGTFRPAAAVFPGGIPAGKNVVWSSGKVIYQQELGVVTANTVYTLKVWVGRRANLKEWQGYRVVLTGGDSMLAHDYSSIVPAPGTFRLVTVRYTAKAGDPNIGLPLGINLVGLGAEVNFAKVSLEAVGSGPNSP